MIYSLELFGETSVGVGHTYLNKGSSGIVLKLTKPNLGLWKKKQVTRKKGAWI